MKAYLLAVAIAVALVPSVASAQNPASRQCVRSGGGCVGDPNTATGNASTAVRSGGTRLRAFGFARFHHDHHHHYRWHHWR